VSRTQENTGFICEHCGARVEQVTNGSYRNHCPVCLYSKHVDETPGDRSHDCRGLMAPVALKFKSGKGFQVVHRCLSCGEKRVNRVAERTRQPDDPERLATLSTAAWR